VSGNIVYIPILCCGQPMAEIYEGEKRIAATCPICKKTWRPTETSTWKTGSAKMYGNHYPQVIIDEWPSELEEKP